MPALSDSETLALWERGKPCHPLDRALLALRAIERSESESAADWPLGRRNHALLELHATWFGSQLEALAACPVCSENVEFELNVRDLAAPQWDGEHQRTVAIDEQIFRLPTSRDVAYAAKSNSEREGAIALLERCRIGGAEPSGWTDEIIERVGDSLAAADPMAETRLALTCP